MIHKTVILVLITSCMIQCTDNNDTNSSDKLLTALSPSSSGIDFKNQITETDNNNHLVWESIYNGAGVGIGDINNDGLQDIYFCGNMTADKLYLNEGDMTFKDVTNKAGIKETSWSSGVTIADVNNDGLLDIYVSKMSWERDNKSPSLRKNKLYINKGDSQFVESAEQYGIADMGHTTQASFFDYNKDGLLDLYVMNAPSHRYDQKLDYMKTNTISYEFKDHLYLNKGDKFEDVTLSTIGKQEHAYGLGLATVDINQDGWTDIYVANDFEKPDLMLINNQKGGFDNKLTNSLKHTSYSSMGMDIADINNDGLSDIFVLDMQSGDHVRSKVNMPSMDIRQFWQNVGKGYYFQYMSNMLQLNTGTGKYAEIGQLAGIASTDWSWSVLMADIDNDSYRDAMITNGINRNIKDNDFNLWMEKERKNNKKANFLKMSKKTKVEKIKNFAYQNDRGNLKFLDKSEEWGFDHNGFSFGAAYGDLDNDGDLDMVINNNNEKSIVYRNNSDITNHYLRIQTRKDNHISINAQAVLYSKGTKQYAELSTTRGYQSSTEPFIHFGLGEHSIVDSVVIQFLDGKIKKIIRPKADSTYVVDWAEGQKSQPYLVDNTSSTFFNEITSSAAFNFKHQENKYNDFLKQILIPHMQSKNGPFISSTDIDKDGSEDLFVGGAKGQRSSIWLNNDKKVPSSTNAVLEEDNSKEDMSSVWVDIDNDGDKDLYVVSGGSEDDEGSEYYRDRLYINKGKGSLVKASTILPNSNGSVVVSIDINKDGYQDLFVGGRMKGQQYPYPGVSHLLINNKGELVEDSDFKFSSIGMVTSAKVIDINKDGWDDLIVVGEWMQPTFLINNKGVLEDQTKKWLPKNNIGWWFEVNTADLDNDGVDEILLGNIGVNNKFHVSDDHTLKVYSADFDKNNSNDIVLAKDTKYGEVPVRGRECSSEQLPYIKRKFESYDKFAHAGIEEILGEKNIKDALKLEANNFQSGYLKLVGNPADEDAHYKFIPFPIMAQFSAVQAIETLDANGDDMLDIVVVGNHFDAEVETTRHDASFGAVLINQGKGVFKALAPHESGFEAGNNAKDMVQITIGGKKCLVVSNNNYWAQVFEVKK